MNSWMDIHVGYASAIQGVVIVRALLLSTIWSQASKAIVYIHAIDIITYGRAKAEYGRMSALAHQ